MNQARILAVILILLSPMAVNADLIEGLCNGSNDPSVTCDTETGLEWLDLTETLGLSVNDFLANVGGFTTDGWLLANFTMVDQLFLNGGAVDISGTPNAGNDAPAALFLALLGDTFEGRGLGRGFASVDATFSETPQYCLFISDYGCDESTGVFRGHNYAGTAFNDARIEFTGVWAYREGSIAPVPEPSTLALLGIGLLGMGAARRRKKV